MLNKKVLALRIGSAGVLVIGISMLGVTTASAQQKPHPVPKGYSWLYNFHSGKCAYIAKASAKNGAKLIQGTCKNSREFGFLPKTGFSGSEYFFQDSVNLPSTRHHFLCVSVADTRRGSQLRQEPCDYQNPPTKQRFVFHAGLVVKRYKWEVIQSVASDECVNIARASSANGAAVQQQLCASVHHHSSWFIFVKPGTNLPCPCHTIAAVSGAARRSGLP